MVVFEITDLIPAVIVGLFITGLLILAYQYGKGKARVYPVPRDGYRTPRLELESVRLQMLRDFARSLGIDLLRLTIGRHVEPVKIGTFASCPPMCNEIPLGAKTSWPG